MTIQLNLCIPFPLFQFMKNIAKALSVHIMKPYLDNDERGFENLILLN